MQSQEYQFIDFQSVSYDMEQRAPLIENFRSMFKKKISLEQQNAEKLKSFVVSSLCKPINNPKNSSQIIFNSLITAFKKEAEHLQAYVEKNNKIISTIEENLESINKKNKKFLARGKYLHQEEQTSKEGLEKKKIKFEKKSEELTTLISEYITGLLGQSFHKMQKISTKINEYIEKDYRTLKADYLKKLEQHEQFLSKNKEEMNEVIKMLRNSEQNKFLLMKGCFINYMVERSNFGGYFCQEGSRLPEVSNISERFPQSLNHTKQNSSNKIIDICGYPNKIFQSLDRLIQFGVTFCQIKQPIERSSRLRLSTAEVIQDSTPQEKPVYVLVFCLCQNLFYDNDESNPQEKSQKLNQLLNKGQENRQAFIHSLLQFRQINRLQIKQNNFTILSQVIRHFLDLCKADHDTSLSKMVMFLSQSFYTLQDKQKKYLRQCIRDHKIWEDRHWWECVFLESVYEKLNNDVQREDMNKNIWDYIGSGVIKKNFAYGQAFQIIVREDLKYYLSKMKLFFIEKQHINRVMKRYVKMFDLPLIMVDQIEQILLRQTTMIYDQDNESSTYRESFFNSRSFIDDSFMRD